MSEQLDAWAQLFSNPKSFFIKDRETNDMGLFITAMIIFCLGYGIDRVDRQLVKFDVRGTLDDFEFLNSWPGYWLVSIVGGAIGGYIAYLIGGWFYNVRVKWSKGKGDLKYSRRIYLFANFYVYLANVVVSLCATLILPLPYDPYAEFSAFDGASAVILLFMIFYSLYISFSGVMATTGADKTRATIWFIVLPAFFYIAAFGALILLLWNAWV
ncbi:MAG: Yip1 family protein [Bacteroidota bacterium]